MSVHLHFSSLRHHGRYSPPWWCWSNRWSTWHWTPRHRHRPFLTWCPIRWRPTYIPHPVFLPVYITQYRTVQVPVPVTAPPVDIVQRDPCDLTHGEAWELLAADQAGPALEAFACLARENPYDGVPHIGYAIANALFGSHESAFAIMQHAVQVDAESLLYVPEDSRIDGHLLGMLDTFSDRAAQAGNQSEALFMVAAIRTILDDAAGAYFAVNQSLSHDGRNDAALQLRSLLEQLLAEQMNLTTG